MDLVFGIEEDDDVIDYEQYIIRKKLRVKRVFILDESNNNIAETILVKKYVFTQKDLNHIQDLKAQDLKKICKQFKLTYTNVQDAKSLILEYLKQNFSSISKNPQYFEEKWSVISPILPAFQLYDSSDYKNPTNMVQLLNQRHLCLQEIQLIYYSKFHSKRDALILTANSSL